MPSTSPSNRTVLDNGISIITEEIDHVRSVSLGVWVRNGSVHEPPAAGGLSHFIEHMLFKGTEKRSAFDIAWAVDSVGGHMNAFTSKEMSSFYVKAPDYFLAAAIDVLADIFKCSRFDPGDIDREKLVVAEEIRMVDDTPDDYIHDYFCRNFWDRHPLGLPVLGTLDSVESFRRDAMLDFFGAKYGARNLVIAAAGNLRHGDVVTAVEKDFGDLPGGLAGGNTTPASASSKFCHEERDLEQTHVIVGAPAPSVLDPMRYAASFINTLLGAGMSSRLFQEIREKRGLAYSIYSYVDFFQCGGLFGIYFGAREEAVVPVIGLIAEELKKIRDGQITDEEFRAIKEQMKGSFLLSMESTDSRMSRLAKQEIYFGRTLSFGEIIDSIDAVTRHDVALCAGAMFDPDRLAVALLGAMPHGGMPEGLLGMKS